MTAPDLVSLQGKLILSYSDATGKEYTLNCGTVTAVSDDIKANVLQTPIPVYSADNAFAFDTGSTENLQFTIVRRNPVSEETNPGIPDNVPDIYEADWVNTEQWSNRVWKMALISMIDRWQMKTDGVQVLFTPIVQVQDSPNDPIRDVYQATIDVRGYMKSLSITYDISSFEVLRVQLAIAVGSIHKQG